MQMCQSLGVLILRLSLGIVFAAHGGQKMFGWWGGHGWSGTMEAMSQSYPSFLVALLIITEFFGGICIILGLLTRFWSAGLAIAMLVATIKVHFANGFFLGGEGGNGFEYNLVLIAMALCLALAGPGRYAIADCEAKLLKRGSPPTSQGSQGG